MNANERELTHNELLYAVAERVIGAAYEVANTLGGGFLEKVYEKAMCHEMSARGLQVRTHAPFPLLYKGHAVGEYVADLLVEGRLIVELKCVDRFANEHVAQCINYLKASGCHMGLLINFQRSKLDWKRIALNL
jgi:GxxExxY protein